jgi:hypothetical protein
VAGDHPALIAGGWFVLKEKYCWLVADKPSERIGSGQLALSAYHIPRRINGDHAQRRFSNNFQIQS